MPELINIGHARADRRNDLEAAPGDDEIRDHLARVLASSEFGVAHRLKQFLLLIVEETLAGRGQELSAPTIAAKLYGTHELSNQDKAGVRVMANRLRTKLDAYYATQGAYDPVRIVAPKGTYTPQLVRHEPKTDPDLATTSSATISAPLTVAPPIRPVIRIVGFKAVGADAQADMIANALNEEIVVAFAANKWTIVLDSLATAGGIMIGNQSALPTTGELFQFEGGLRRQGRGIRLNARMVSLPSGEVLWRHADDMHLGQLQHVDDHKNLAAKFQRELTDRVAGVLFGPNRVLSPNFILGKLSALDAFSLFTRFLLTGNALDHSHALRAFESAIEKDPCDVAALGSYAQLSIDTYGLCLGDPNEALDTARRAIEQATSIDPDDPELFYAKAVLSFYDGKLENGIDFARRLSRKKEDNYYSILGGYLLGIAGRHKESWDVLGDILEDVAQMPGWLNLPNFYLSYDEEDYFQALEEANSYGMEGYFWGPLIRAASYGQLGFKKHAAVEVKRLLELYPEFPNEPALRLKGVTLLDRREHLFEGLRKAGLKLRGY